MFEWSSTYKMESLVLAKEVWRQDAGMFECLLRKIDSMVLYQGGVDT
jgi:hypothetical protein